MLLGALLGKIVIEGDKEEDVKFDDPNLRNLVARVSLAKNLYTTGRETLPYWYALACYPAGERTYLQSYEQAVDCGMKNNQIRCFVKRGVKVKVVPWDHPLLEEKDIQGVFYFKWYAEMMEGDSTSAQINCFTSS